MDKMALLMELRAVQKSMNASIDRMMEKVMAMDDDAPASVPAPQGGRADGVFNAKMSASYLGISLTKFWGSIREGVLPAGDYSLGPRSPRWRQSDLDACLAARCKEEEHAPKKKAGRKARFSASARQGV